MKVDEIAGIIEAEASVLDFQGKLAVAQCVADNRYNAAAFAKPAEKYSVESRQAAELSVYQGARRYTNAKIMQFRSFTKYGNADGSPDLPAVYESGVPRYYMYIGSDSKDGWGHFYFGRYTQMARPFRILLIAGHGRNVDGSFDPGACGCGLREADLTRELVTLLKSVADANGLLCDVAEDRNYYSYFKHGGQYDFTPYNYVLEVHFNAGGNVDSAGDGRKRGTMVYIDQDEKGHSVEDAILRNLYAIGSVQAWDGVVVTQRQESYKNGLMVQRHVREQGVSHAVLETCFITDMDDVNWYRGNKQLIATQVIRGIIEGFGLGVQKDNPYQFVGKGIATAQALEDMMVRVQPSILRKIVGTVFCGQKVEVLEMLDNGWYKIVWPGSACGYAYTSNAKGKYYRIV
jgi:N-acetylmuramoyl-L-alanine amidase